MFTKYSKEDLERIVELLNKTSYRASRGHNDVLRSRNYLIAYCRLNIRDKKDQKGQELPDQELYDKFIDEWLASDLGREKEKPRVR